MKQIFIFFYFIVFCLGLNAQNIIVDYAVTVNKEEKNIFDEICETFIFKLHANETESLFGLEENLQVKEEFNYTLAKVVIVESFNKYYINFTNKNKIKEKEFDNNLFNIESELIEYNWKITKETKKIKNFTCYKATRITQKTIHKTKKIVDVLITAWFCPEINYSYGPIGNYGLPGLILELNKDRITFYVKKVEFKDDCISIEVPKKGEKVSEKEFDNIVKEFVEN